MAQFEVRATSYGRPSVELLAAQVKEAKRGDLLAPVTVIVASNYAAVSIRRALAAQPGGIASVSFLTLGRLAERLGAATLARAGRRPVSTPILTQAVRAVLASDPGVFAPVADHPATELALVAVTRELAGLTDSALDAVAACSPRAGDVVRIARRVQADLAASWYDQHDLLATAADNLRAGAAIGPVVVHLLQDLSPAAADLLRAMAERQSVRVNVGLTGDPGADRQVLEVHGQAGIAVGATDIVPAHAAAVVSVSDPDEEVRAAIRLVTQWMRDSIRLGRVALLYGMADPYARLLHEQLTAAGIPHNGAPVRAIGDMLLGRTLQRLLALPDRAFRRSDVMAIVAGAPVLDGGDRAPSRAWERISRHAGVVGGEDWDRRLAVFVGDQRVRADEAERDEREALASHLRRDAERAEQLTTFVRALRADLAAIEAAGSWQAMVEQANGLIGRYLGDERRRWRWPEGEQQAAERVEEALDRLACLDAIGPAPTVEIFRRTLAAELEVALRRIGHFGDGVLTGHVSMAIGLELDRVVILGMAEGAFPARRLEDSVLPDRERRAAAGQLPLRGERLEDDHRQLLAAFAAATETTVCFPRGDLRRQGDRAASRWLLAEAARLAGRASLFTDELAAVEGGWLTQVPSFAAGLTRAAFPSTAQQFRLATMLRSPGTVIAGEPVLALGLEMANARRGDRFTRFDGNLAGRAVPDYTSAGVMSATRLQTWAECPHAFFMQYLLGVEVIEDPEHRLEMQALDKGSLIHAILDRFGQEMIGSGRGGPWNDYDRRRLIAIADDVCTEYGERGVTGRALFWRRDRARLLADLERFAAEDAGRPIRTELKFDHVPYPLPDGRSVAFRGAVDRVDQAADGTLRVIDYKSGGSGRYGGLTAADPHQRGTRLQLGVYGAVVRHLLGGPEVEAGYWFVTTKGDFDWVGYVITPEIEASIGEAVVAIVDGIAAGVFPGRPPAEPSYQWVDCWYCSPDGLSSREARRDWERKRLASALAGYLQLCEPEVLDDDT